MNPHRIPGFLLDFLVWLALRVLGMVAIVGLALYALVLILTLPLASGALLAVLLVLALIVFAIREPE